MKCSSTMREVYYIVNIDAHKVHKTSKKAVCKKDEEFTPPLPAGFVTLITAIFVLALLYAAGLPLDIFFEAFARPDNAPKTVQYASYMSHTNSQQPQPTYNLDLNEMVVGAPKATITDLPIPSDAVEPEPSVIPEIIEPDAPIQTGRELANGSFTVCNALVEAGCSAEIQEIAWNVTQYEYPEIVNYSTFLAQLYHESRWVTNLVSATNDYGISQINECNLERLAARLGCTVEQVKWDPLWNMRAAMLVWQDNYTNYSYTNLAGYLMRYNQGPGGAAANISAGRVSAYAACIINDDIPMVNRLLDAG